MLTRSYKYAIKPYSAIDGVQQLQNISLTIKMNMLMGVTTYVSQVHILTVLLTICANSQQITNHQKKTKKSYLRVRKLYQDKHNVFSYCFATEPVNVVKRIRYQTDPRLGYVKQKRLQRLRLIIFSFGASSRFVNQVSFPIMGI